MLAGDARYHEPSALTYPITTMRDNAASIIRFDDGIYARATRINDFVAAHMRYVPDSTSVLTTAVGAFARSAGVSQDYARIMITIARERTRSSAKAGSMLGSRSSHPLLTQRAPSSRHSIPHTADTRISTRYSSLRDVISPM